MAFMLSNTVTHLMLFVFDSLAVREFLCLDDPPGPFDSLEESRVSLQTSPSRVAAAKITASGGGWLGKKAFTPEKQPVVYRLCGLSVCAL